MLVKMFSQVGRLFVALNSGKVFYNIKYVVIFSGYMCANYIIADKFGSASTNDGPSPIIHTDKHRNNVCTATRGITAFEHRIRYISVTYRHGLSKEWGNFIEY